MTLGNAAAARVRLIVWCRDCGRQIEPDPGEMAQRYGAECFLDAEIECGTPPEEAREMVRQALASPVRPRPLGVAR
jgi:hypothetical protein